MKRTTFIGKYAFEPYRFLITRPRVAYLLRAARSRRRGNVVKDGRGYFIRDCNFSLIA